MQQRIVVRLKNVYGNQTVYPVCPTAKLLARLSGHITFTPENLALVEQLGYEVTVEQQTLATPVRASTVAARRVDVAGAIGYQE